MIAFPSQASSSLNVADSTQCVHHWFVPHELNPSMTKRTLFLTLFTTPVLNFRFVYLCDFVVIDFPPPEMNKTQQVAEPSTAGFQAFRWALSPGGPTSGFWWASWEITT